MSLLWLIPEALQKRRVWRRQLSLKHCLGTSPGTVLVEESHEGEIPKDEVALGCSCRHGPCLWASGVAEVLTALSEPKNICSFPSREKLVEPTPFLVPLLERERITELFEPLYHQQQMAIREFYTWQPEGSWGTSGHLCIAVVLL